MKVVYPPVDLTAIEQSHSKQNSWSDLLSRYPQETEHFRSRNFILSLNRYEKKKQIGLAIHALICLKCHYVIQSYSASVPIYKMPLFSDVHQATANTSRSRCVHISSGDDVSLGYFVGVGGFDPELNENSQVLEELRQLVLSEGLEENREVYLVFLIK